MIKGDYYGDYTFWKEVEVANGFFFFKSKVLGALNVKLALGKVLVL